MNKDDPQVVFVRPKAIIGSSGTTWANETENLRKMMPDKFEVLSGGDVCNYSSQFGGICAGIHDDIKLFSEMTEDEDIARVCYDPESIYHNTKVNEFHT